MLNKISFKNYKSFKERQELELKPITILIGKNSAGKSAITKLFTLIENSLTGSFPEPLLLENDGVELGDEFKDLIFGRTRIGSLEITIEDENETLDVIVASETGSRDLPKIFSWKLTNKSGTIERQENEQYKGFVLQTKEENSTIKSLSLTTEYIGPFRDIPERWYGRPRSARIEKVGNTGADAYQILIQDALTTEKKLLNKVSTWYQQHFDGWGIRLNEDKNPQFQIELTRNSGRLNINLRDVGQGMSQAFPLVVSAFMETTNETLVVIEQPELHLHPGAHGDLAEMFVDSIHRGGKKYLVETHSQNFILRIRRLIAEGKLSNDAIVIYSIEFNEDLGTSQLIKIVVDERGDIDYWPEGVFSESLDEVIAIRKAQKSKQL
jgi:predicted ATPase